MSDGESAETPDDAAQQAAAEAARVLRRVYFRRALAGVAVGVALASVAVAVWVFPYYRDDRHLDRIVKIVALDWRDFGEARARVRLAYEVDRAGIGLWVADEDCDLHGLEQAPANPDPASGVGSPLEVRCAWSVPVRAFGFVAHLRFSSASEVTP